MNQSFLVEHVPDQSGRTIVVTGANTGIGFDAAKVLVERGAHVVLACRSADKMAKAAASLRTSTRDADVSTVRLDLGDLSSVSDGAAELVESHPVIDVLVNNAGVMIPPKSTTADGFELQFGTNHLGHFALTAQTMESVLAADAGRVVTISSIAHKSGRMNWDDLQWEQSYSRSKSYGQSKLANLLFTFALQRRLEAAGVNAIALAAHPGVAATELSRHIPLLGLPGIRTVLNPLVAMWGQPSADGAVPTLAAATDPAAEGGDYYGPVGRNEMKGPVDKAIALPHAHREEDQERLWTISEELTGVRFSI